MIDLDALDFSKGGGFVTVVCQDAGTAMVLMVARADREAMERTLATGEMHYHSRARGLWHKGATSGNVQRVVTLQADCDGDAVLACVEPAGPACQTGAVSCFGQAGDGGLGPGGGAGEDERGGPPQEQSRTTGSAHLHPTVAPPIVSTAADILAGLAATIASRAAALPLAEGGTASYTQRLLLDRNLRLKKLGEEVVELAVACGDEDRERAAEEGGDVIFHTLVALAAVGVSLDDVATVLRARAR